MRRFFRFGKPEYQTPKVSPVPEGQGANMNGTYVNESSRQIIVKIFDGGKPEDLAAALGTLEIAKDIVKQTLSLWHVKDQKKAAILVPKGTGNGNGGFHVA